MLPSGGQSDILTLNIKGQTKEPVRLSCCENCKILNQAEVTDSAMAAGEISSRFSILHSSRNSKMGDG